MVAKIKKNRTSIFFVILMVSLLGLFASQSYLTAATYTDFVTGNQTLAKAPFDPGTGSKVLFMESRKIDLSSSKLNSGSGVTHGDVIQLFKIPKNTYVMGFGIRVITATGSSGTSATVGDGASAAGFVGNTTASQNYIKLDVTNLTGASVWQVTAPTGHVNGVTTVNGPLTNNVGAYFTTGASCYEGPDTIDMTIYKDKKYLSGDTPVFEAWVWGFHRPTE